ncbi:MAG: hypothetical protein OHK0022_57920 [Roseiflexaceae bacterium]
MDTYNSLSTPGLSDEELRLLDALLQEEGFEVEEQSTIRPRTSDAELPLSFAQERVWFFDQWEPGTPVYNISFALRLTGRLDAEILGRTLTEIVRRHETLRTTFAATGGRPRQVIAPAEQAAAHLELIDLQHLPEQTRTAETQRLALEAARFSFDLGRGPLLRTMLLRLGAEEHVFLLTIHHIISDGWSNGILQREIVAIYTAFANGLPSPLPPPPIQYADFALWQRAWLQGEVLEQHLAYWQRQLGGLGFLDLPTDRPRPPVQTNNGAHHYLNLPKNLVAGLNSASKRHNVTLFMTLLAAFQVLLHRYSGQSDIAVGSPIANRDLIEVEPVIGFFVNTLILRGNTGGNPRFSALLEQVREVTLEAYAHQNVPFEQLIEVLRPQRDPSRPPLFQAMFVLQNVPLGSSELPGVRLEPLRIDSGTAKFDLMLVLIETPEGMRGSIEYNTDLFEPATIARMAANFQTLLEGVLADPDARIDGLPLLSVAEQEQLAGWNAGTLPLPAGACLHDLVAAQAARDPGAQAVAWGDSSLSYAELERRANQLAHHLIELGVGPDLPVGVCVSRSPELIVALLAVLKAGGAYVPLDPALPAERLAFMAQDAGVRVLLTGGTRAALGQGRWARIDLETDRAAIEAHPDTAPAPRSTPENLAYIIYTSGSTGRPKGVMVTHRSLVSAFLAWEHAYGLRAGQRHLQMANATFDVFSGDLARALCSGGTLVLCPRELLLSPDGLYALLTRERIDCAEFVPAVLRPLLDYLDGNGLRLDSVRLLACGSDSWYMHEYQHIRRLCAPGALVVNSFGVTEATIDSTWYAASEGARAADQLIPIGRPFANTRLYVLDARGQPAPIGVPGELYLGGQGLARGYHDRPDQTAERFLPDPFAGTPGARMYRTGDRARFLADGNVEFIGRIDHQVKLRGFRIELSEIEAVLLQHPAVREAAVVVRESNPGNQRLVAYVVLAENQEPRTKNQESGADDTQLNTQNSTLKTFLRERLPDYMVPASYVFLEALPLTPAGKIDRRALPAPEPGREGEGTFVAPRDEWEQRLAQIWEELLDVRPVGATDNFFDLGGHSLLAVRLVAQVQERMGRRLPLAALFQSPTVEDLARALRAEVTPAPWSPLVALQAGGTQRPFFCIHPAGGAVLCYNELARLLGSDRPFYGLQARGLEQGQEPHQDIPAMVAEYAAAVRGVQPEGPYLIGGWSLGGTLAFELARELRAQGQEVDLLAVIDTGALLPGEPAPEEVEVASLLATALGVMFGRPLRVPADELRPHAPETWTGYILARARAEGVIPPDVHDEQLGRLARLAQAQMRAVQQHRPVALPVRVTLFQTDEVYAGRSERELAPGWRMLATNGVELYRVPGNHYTVVRPPHVQTLAERLRACLDKADTRLGA